MPDCVSVALRGHRARQASERLLAGSVWQDFNLVFSTQKGIPIEPRKLDTQFKRVMESAKLPATIRLHDARHFAASLLLS
jgi:integrase